MASDWLPLAKIVSVGVRVRISARRALLEDLLRSCLECRIHKVIACNHSHHAVVEIYYAKVSQPHSTEETVESLQAGVVVNDVGARINVGTQVH
jgi:hypothetical protein